MRSGYIYLTDDNGTLVGISHDGHWWSLRGSSTNASGNANPSAYYLLLGSTDIYPSAGPLNRYAAFPLRCLSTVLGMGGEGVLK